MAIRRILAPLTGGENDRRVLALACLAARTLEAHLDALFVAPDPDEALPYMGEGVSGAVIEDILRAAKAAAKEAGAAARKSFEAATAEAKIPVSQPGGPGRTSAQLSEVQGRVGDIVERTSRLADLVVFADSAGGAALIESALMSAGRPILLTPQSTLPKSIGQTVAIGWDASAEAAHAVTAAMPFLKLAKTIDIITVRVGGLEAKAADDLAGYLALHGLTARERVVDPKGRSVGQVLLDAAQTSGADLLVMGGYGHSRLREFILGGATRHILTTATMPVLMAH